MNEVELNKSIKEALRQYEAGIQELKAMIFPADYYMDIKSLARHSGISVRKLKDLIRHPDYPLPVFKVEGSIRIKKSEFEKWINRFRLSPEQNTNAVNHIVRDVMKDFQMST